MGNRRPYWSQDNAEDSYQDQTCFKSSSEDIEGIGTHPRERMFYRFGISAWKALSPVPMNLLGLLAGYRRWCQKVGRQMSEVHLKEIVNALPIGLTQSMGLRRTPPPLSSASTTCADVPDEAGNVYCCHPSFPTSSELRRVAKLCIWPFRPRPVVSFQTVVSFCNSEHLPDYADWRVWEYWPKTSGRHHSSWWLNLEGGAYVIITYLNCTGMKWGKAIKSW